MKNCTRLLAVFAALLQMTFDAMAQGTAFTYQGQLQSAGTPANGLYDFQFSLYDAANTNGNQLTSPLSVPSVGVTNGLFTTTVDFQSASFFNGSPRWLAIAVKPHGGTNFTLLQPFQPITAAPYAITAGNGIGSSNVTNLNGTFTGQFSGNGSNLVGVSAATTASVTSNSSLLMYCTPQSPLMDVSGYTAASFNSTPNSFYTGPALCVNAWSYNGNDGGTEFDGNTNKVNHPGVGFINRVNDLRQSPLYGLGFNTVVIDAGWFGYRDANGNIHENANMWPDGISNCAKYAHSLGIKVGIWYGCIQATNVGASYEGLEGFVTNFTYDGGTYWVGNTNSLQMQPPSNLSNNQLMAMDATTFVNWGIDYVKYECGTNDTFDISQLQQAMETFESTSQALGHPFYLMGASGGFGPNPIFKGLMNAPRSGDFDMPNGGAPPGLIFFQYCNNFFWAAQWQDYSGPGSYVSTDIMPTTTPSLCNTMMIMGAMLSSELCVGSPANWPIINKSIVQIDQDPAAIMAYPVATNGNLTVWEKPLAQQNSFAVMFLNTDDASNISYTISSLSLFGTAQTNMFCMDLSSNITFTVSNNWTVTVPTETAYGFKLTPVSATLYQGN